MSANAVVLWKARLLPGHPAVHPVVDRQTILAVDRSAIPAAVRSAIPAVDLQTIRQAAATSKYPGVCPMVHRLQTAAAVGFQGSLGFQAGHPAVHAVLNEFTIPAADNPKKVTKM